MLLLLLLLLPLQPGTANHEPAKGFELRVKGMLTEAAARMRMLRHRPEGRHGKSCVCAIDSAPQYSTRGPGFNTLWRSSWRTLHPNPRPGRHTYAWHGACKACSLIKVDIVGACVLVTDVPMPLRHRGLQNTERQLDSWEQRHLYGKRCGDVDVRSAGQHTHTHTEAGA